MREKKAVISKQESFSTTLSRSYIVFTLDNVALCSVLPDLSWISFEFMNLEKTTIALLKVRYVVYRIGFTSSIRVRCFVDGIVVRKLLLVFRCFSILWRNEGLRDRSCHYLGKESLEVQKRALKNGTNSLC